MSANKKLKKKKEKEKQKNLYFSIVAS